VTHFVTNFILFGPVQSLNCLKFKIRDIEKEEILSLLILIRTEVKHKNEI